MHRILVVDDEEAIRKNLDTLLSLEGFEVATAPNGQHGLVLARSMLPDIIITDINMPLMDGYALLEAVRAHPELERTVVIMLTAAEDREHMRKGMARGADDYITKPFKRDELLDAIAAQLEKIRRFDRYKNHAISQEKLRLQNNASGGQSPQASQVSDTGFAHSAARSLQGTVLFADIRNFTALAERFTEDELSKLLSDYFAHICQPVIAYGGTHLKMLGDGLLALFEVDHHAAALGDANAHASRAVSAALALHAAALEFRAFLAHSYHARGLPEFHVGVGLHSGEVSLGQHGLRELTPHGHTIDTATRLQAAGKMLGWAVTASATTTLLAGSGVHLGREQSLGIDGPTPLPTACEVLDYRGAGDLQQGLDSAVIAFESAVVELAAQDNAQTTARAAKASAIPPT
jgi:serine/threonine-protein kinase PpkA